MSTSSNAEFSPIERREGHPIALARRQLLALLFAAFAAPDAMTEAPTFQARSRRVVIVNGWVLLEDDVYEVASRVV